MFCFFVRKLSHNGLLCLKWFALAIGKIVKVFKYQISSRNLLKLHGLPSDFYVFKPKVVW